MNVEQFCARFGGEPRAIRDVVGEWQFDEADEMLGALERECDGIIGSAVIVGDAVRGGGMLDEIPRELRDAFVNLMGDRADSYAEMRRILLDKVRPDGGPYVEFDDPRLQGFINKVKGQIGENIFQRHAGAAAELARSGSQEAWDVAVKQADGLHGYVQVKLYADPHKVVQHMIRVHEKVALGTIYGCDGEVVQSIDFAVPEDIAEQVCRIKGAYAELDQMHVLTIPVSADGAADYVKEGLSNVGPEQLSHFFDELLGGAVVAGSMHAIVNGFLWYKQAKEFAAAFGDAVASTALSTAGIGIGLAAELLFRSAFFTSGAGISGRILLARVARSRWGFANFLKASIAENMQHIELLRTDVQRAAAAT